MDFLFQSPEINSARMYTGPGSAPMLSGAAGWTAIASQLADAAASITSTVTELAAAWMGPSYVSMASAALMLSGWYENAAVSAAQTAAQAQAAAVAYETAFAATVPPFVVAANRVRLATLVATNFLGVNTPAIAATEAEYMEMWAQDVAAMSAYQMGSMAATQLAPLQPLTPLTTGVPAPAVSSSTGTVGSTLSGLQSFLPQSFSDLMAGVQAFGSMATLAFEPVSAVMDEGLWGAPTWQAPALGDAVGAADAAADAAASAASALANAPTPVVNVPSLGSVAGAMGRAPAVGGLSVPSSWTAQTGTPSSLVTAITPADGEAGTPGCPGMPMASWRGGREQQKQDLKYLNRPRMLPIPVN